MAGVNRKAQVGTTGQQSTKSTRDAGSQRATTNGRNTAKPQPLWSARTCPRFLQTTCRRRMREGVQLYRAAYASLLWRQVAKAAKAVTSHRTPNSLPPRAPAWPGVFPLMPVPNPADLLGAPILAEHHRRGRVEVGLRAGFSGLDHHRVFDVGQERLGTGPGHGRFLAGDGSA